MQHLAGKPGQSQSSRMTSAAIQQIETLLSPLLRTLDALGVIARHISPVGYSHLLGGYSGGGIITLEMVRQLQELGDTVDHVILFDSVPSETNWTIRLNDSAAGALRTTLGIP